MLANRYDRPAEAPILNTYVPINFDMLYKIGSTQKLAVEDAAKNMYDTISKFGEFHSPSDIDTENWYKNTIGKFDDLIQQVAENPDRLKDAYWRNAFNSRLYSLDYGELGRLRQSREGMLARLKANQELMLRGGYNPLLHDVDFANYDTLGSGLIFNDVSPLAYKSVVDMVKPYVDNLKGKYLGNKNGMIYNGVTAEDTDAQLKKNWSSIENSPHYLQNLEIIKKQTGLDDAAAIKLLNDKIITAGREFTWNDAKRDPLTVAYARHSGSGGDSEEMSLLNLTDELEITAGKAFASGLGKAKTPEELSTKLKDVFDASKKANVSFNTAINDVINQLSAGIDNEANEVLTKQNTQTGKTTKDGYRIGNSTSDFILRTRLAYNLMGEAPEENRLQNDFEKGEFKNFLVAGTPSITTDGRNIYHNKYIFIPESEILGKYSAKDIATIQGDRVVLTEDQVSVTESTDAYGDTRTSVNTKLKPGAYIRIPVSTTVSRSGKEATGNDSEYAKNKGYGQDMRDVMQANSQRRRLLQQLK